VSEPRPEELIGVLRHLKPACGDTVVIAIDGPSGSGKTGLARELAHALGAEILHLDNVHRDWHSLAATPPVIVHDVLEPLSRRETGRTPRWEWGADSPGEELVVPPVPFVILDGCGSGARVIRPHLSYLIWVDAAADERRERARARDGDTSEEWWDTWAEQECEHFALEGTKDAADLRLPRDVDA
jgi:para-aminobenzoate synthetase